MELVIYTPNFQLAEEMKNSAPAGISVAVHEKVTRSADSISTAIIILEFIKTNAADVLRDVFVVWLCSKCNDDKNKCQIKHGGKNIAPKVEVIKMLIQEELDFKNNAQDDDKHDA